MTLRFITWDVEHGSAAYIRTPNSKHVAVDMGARTAGNASFSPLVHLMRSGVSQLDLVIITHPHLDHIEDILNFDKLSPRCLVRPEHLTENDIWAGNRNASPETQRIIRKYIEIGNKYTAPPRPYYNPSEPANNGGVSFQHFIPCQSSTTNLNNHSVVTVISYAGVKILLPGDNESPSWGELLKRPDFKQAISGVDVLVAPHHGRESGFHSELFKYFRPYITIISDGRFVDTSATNRYSAVTKGFEVRSRSRGTSQKRKCVTTRSDGAIEATVGRDSSGRPFLDVTVN